MWSIMVTVGIKEDGQPSEEIHIAKHSTCKPERMVQTLSHWPLADFNSIFGR